MENKLIPLFLISITVLFSSCTDVLKILNKSSLQKPHVSVSDTKITGLSFDHVDLNFTLKIDNPNTMGVTLAGFDYNLEINKKSFVSGKKNDRLTIRSSASSNVTVPVTVKFADIYGAFRDLISADSSKYKISFGLNFDLPVLGAVRIPVSAQGAVPMLKLPRLRLKGIKLNSVNFSGAKLALELKLKNPNAFSMLLEDFNYGLKINGQNWLDGAGKNMAQISARSEQIISLPINLNFLQMGSSLYQLVNSGKGLDYTFDGKLNIKSSNALLKNLKLPVKLSGLTNLLK